MPTSAKSSKKVRTNTGAEAEKRAASDAERVANGDDEGGTKSFLVAGVGGAQKKVETDWSKPIFFLTPS